MIANILLCFGHFNASRNTATLVRTAFLNHFFVVQWRTMLQPLASSVKRKGGVVLKANKTVMALYYLDEFKLLKSK